MDSRNSEFLDQNKRMLRDSLRSLRRQSNGELIDLLAGMNAAGALVFHQKWGMPEPFRSCVSSSASDE